MVPDDRYDPAGPHPHDAEILELLALRALGEPADGLDEQHLASCAACRGELDALRRVVDAARSAPADAPRRLEAPPQRVWEGVSAELGLAADSDRTGRSAPRRADDRPVVLPGVPRARPEAGSSTAARGGGGTERRVPRGRAALLAAAAAVAGVLAGAGATALLDDEPEPATPYGTVEARAVLTALPERSGSGEAVLERSPDARRLVVTASGLSAGDGFTEVWLLDAEAGRLVSLGVLQGRSGSFPVPAALDIGDYPLVDLSLEPFDGDPGHSSDSLVRGELRS